MRGARYDRYGPPEVLEVGELPEPTARPREVTVRVHAAALNPKDVLVRKGKLRAFTGRRFPQVPGYDLAGVVDSVGAEVRTLAVGDPVHGMIQSWRAGACAERAVVPEDELAPKPASLTFAEAAAVPLAALTALQALRDELGVHSGDEVLLNGASGGVGTFAVQIARILAGRVVAVCSGRNAAWVRDLGADEVLPYDERPILERGRRFDAVFDIFGTAPYPAAKAILRPRGRYVTAIPRPAAVVRGALSRMGITPARLVIVRSRRRDLEVLGRWIEAGRLRPILDRVLPLERIADAHRRVETKRTRGKVVVTLGTSA
ncbi:MAG: NAD(P)-dependent alcohol dehydrogenase [Sandaracinaceae bacterium]